MRPLSMIAMRSCTQSKGLPRSTWGRRKPAQPASRGAAANSSDKVALGGAGRTQRAPSRDASGGSPDAGDWAGPERVGTAPPATRDKPFATRLTTFLFYFCSFSRDSGARVNAATRRTKSGGAGDARWLCERPGHHHRLQSGWATLDLGEERADLVHD